MIASIARKEFQEIFQPEWNPESFDLRSKQKKKTDKKKNRNKTKKEGKV